jgi:hypothetical protein
VHCPHKRSRARPAPPRRPSPQLPLLLEGIASRPAQHAAIALRCATAALAALGPPAGASAAAVTAAAGGVSGGPPTARLLPGGREERAALLAHLTRLLLYQRPSSDAPRTPLAAAAAAAAAAMPQVRRQGRGQRDVGVGGGWPRAQQKGKDAGRCEWLRPPPSLAPLRHRPAPPVSAGRSGRSRCAAAAAAAGPVARRRYGV